MLATLAKSGPTRAAQLALVYGRESQYFIRAASATGARDAATLAASYAREFLRGIGLNPDGGAA
jgi:hypothetical protein